MRFSAVTNHDKTRLSSSVRQPLRFHSRRRAKRRCAQGVALTIAGITAVAGSVLRASPAAADFTDTLREAVMQVGRSTCGQLRPEPLADRTAAIAARSTDTYLNHAARAVPVEDPLPILKDLGSTASKAKLFQGAGKTEADAIRFIFLSGYKDIPDCSYTEFGVSALPNDNPNGYFLTALVLVGP